MRLSPSKSLAVAIAVAAVVAAVTVVVSFPRQQNEPTVAQNGTDTNSTEVDAKDVIYTAKFECGTISGDEGPLRPGYYDTDIGILNKQDFPVQFTWTAVINDGQTSNPIIKSLQPETSTSIVCDHLRQLVGDKEFVEGFVIIKAPVSGQLFAESSTVVGRQGSVIDILDVQVFYTVNSLDEVPHEVLVDKIVFTVLSDPSGKIPQEFVNRTLDVTVRSGLDEISDPEIKVKGVFAEEYGLTPQETQALEIRIESISVGAGMTIDNHALTLSRVPPQTSG
jgi:hypothetical protein